MKKIILILMIFLLLCACAKKEESKPVEEPEPQVNEPEKQEEKGEPVKVGDDIVSFLAGVWTIVTNDENTNGSIIMEIDGDERTVKIIRPDDDYIVADIELMDSYDDPKTKNDAMKFIVKEASSTYTDKYGEITDTWCSYMQYIVGSFVSKDYLLLRELGNGQSIIDYEVLGGWDNIIGDYGWLFVRETHNGFPSLDENESLKYKNDSFYAYCWGRGDSYLLQKVDVIEQEEEWYEGAAFNTLRIVPDGTEYSNTIFLYNGTDLPKDNRTSLVKVNTDANGVATIVKEYAYTGYGAYDAE